MPVLRKRNLGMGWLWSARWCSTPHPRFMLCGAFPISYVHISRCFAAYPLLLVESCPTLFDFRKPMLI